VFRFARPALYYERGRVLKSERLEALTSGPHEFRNLSSDLKLSNLQTYFHENHPSPELVQGILRAHVENCSSYLDQPLKLPKHDDIDTHEHSRRCKDLARFAKPYDLLLTFDPSSHMSRLISWVDSGPWSHSAVLLKSGKVFEAVTSGVRVIDLEHYLRQPYRLGLYRLDPPPPDPEEMEAFALSTIGDRYAYRKAFVAGTKRFFRFRRRPNLPNDLALVPGVSLVCRI
jgi:hypothetical protein